MRRVRSQIPDSWALENVLAYDTVKLVRVLDRRLGFVYYAVFAAVIAYVVVVVFVLKKQYMDFDKSTGWIIVKVMKPQVSHLGTSWDVYDRITNPGEAGAVFIPTRILITRGQTQEDEYCESPVHNCTVPEDCDIGNEMLQKKECVSGRCLRRQWCPAEDEGAPTTETHYLELDQVQLRLQNFLRYHRFNVDVSTADEVEPVRYPHSRANTYRLRDLLRMTNSDPEEFKETGAVMIINALFDCDLNKKDCDMKVETATVDKNFYYHIYNHVYFEGGVRKRDSYRMFGIRLVAFTTGFGEKASMAQIILQISSAIALLTVAETIADFWLTHVVPESRHYTEKKIIDMDVSS
uniref:Purinergic receptor n=1 Tax=Alexandrium monilatum TaxID=311494 RepID=A0A6T0X194_9DINO|mmetsp:Transcript_36666/g.114152  ORF Transcript_36666/g.114152 Transcript_36666/m.114152 type:complete len:350 (+) Transcript_36666:179-1228(+)